MTRAVSPDLRTSGPRASEGPHVAISRERVSLTNGRYTVRLSGRGGGQSHWGDLSVTRSRHDEICDTDGFHVYLRDVDDGFVWSAGYQPTQVVPTTYEFRGCDSAAEIIRTDRDIECRLTIAVAPSHDCEIRRCRLVNRGAATRQIELTSYLEWVLAPQNADANHPTFSKLFVETQYCAERTAILARRRPRSSDDAPIWGCHAVVHGSAGGETGEVQFETSRVAFLGRGRTLKTPLALNCGSILTGQVGPVLDPIASLRTSVILRPNEPADVAFLLGAAADHAAIVDILSAFRDSSAIDSLFDDASNGLVTDNGVAAASQRQRAGGERVILHPPHSSSGQQKADASTKTAFRPASAFICAPHSSPAERAESLQFDNGHGGFTADGREYVIRLGADAAGHLQRPPMPWVNVIANEAAGFLTTECGAGYMWAGNSRLNRITAWHNDPLCDPHAEALWVRDEDAGVYWSLTPGPTPAPAEYIARHGWGYTTFEHESFELAQSATMFMAREDPVKITRVQILNRSGRTRRLSLFSYVHWALGGLACETAASVETAYDVALQAHLATNPQREYGGYVAFSAVHRLPLPQAEGRGELRQYEPPSPRHGEPPAATGHFPWGDGSFTCDRASFIGEAGDIAEPAALNSCAALDGRAGRELDPCSAWQVPIELPPGSECELVFLLGEAADRYAAAALLGKYRAADAVARELDDVKSFWRNVTSAVQVETPDREIDLMVNGWLTYQNLSCRIWGRSAYYQPGGAFGFRDQLQDAAALVYSRPDLTRTQIIRHASKQFVEGDVLHWWHPDTGYGLRTRFSDDLLWLPYVTASYVETTGDTAVLDVEAPFVTGPKLPAGEAETYLCPSQSESAASVYEHCCRALDRGLTTGPHGLPLMGTGDWNDGMNRVGLLGRGESVWLGFFICYILDKFLPICRQRGDNQRAARYTAYREPLIAALNDTGWDGQWYRRAYYDNGHPIGSAESDECQIDALAQAWAVISGVAPPERAVMAMSAVEERLVCRDAGLIRLLAPPFNRTPNDPGYIKGYLPGIRENGGQYTHGVLWAVRALAEMGRGTQATDMLRMLSPVWHTQTPERTQIYQTEPYVVAADVYGEPPHVGRGGWTWYTGSAGWMFRVAVESIFGFSIERGRTIVLKPAISKSWPRCRLIYRLPGEATRYEITIENPNGKETGVTSALADGRDVEVVDGAARIPIEHDGGVHFVVVSL